MWIPSLEEVRIRNILYIPTAALQHTQLFTTTLIEAHDTVDMNRKQTTLHIINAGVSLFPLFYAYGMTNATARGMAQGLINSGGANFNALRLQMASGDTGMTDSHRYFKGWGRR